MEKDIMFCVSYEQAIGSLMYLMMCTRSDVALAMGKVSTYMSIFEKVHLKVEKWIMKYLKRVVDLI